jgi:transitional endoplasmic reticulum ATPase
MRISRVKTASFAISQDAEREALDRAKVEGNVRLHKRYLPLGKFLIVKAKGTDKGIFFKKKSTTIKRDHIYVDLAYANIYYVNPTGVLKSQLKVEKNDILRQVMNLSVQTLSTLNYVWERGSVRYEGLDKDAVTELMRRGLAVVYEPGDSQLLNIIKMAADERMVNKYSVKTSFFLLKYGDHRYDLPAFLKVAETIDESYERDPIRHSVKKIEETISYLFNCDSTLEEITYLPYIIFEHAGQGEAEAVSTMPVCPKGSRAKKGYPNEVKLAPISLSTELYDGNSVPIEKSTISFAELGGLQKAKSEIMEAIIYPLVSPELSKKFGKKSGGGLLLYGPPGCGKTQLARAAVTECGVSFFNVNVSDIMNQSGDEARKLHEVFEKAASSAPSIIFFDEIDALCSRKASADESKQKVLNQFLMDMSGVERMSEGVLVIAATNVPWELDPALRRAGRFSRQIYIPPPDMNARLEIFKICAKERPIAAGVNFVKLSELTEGYSGADIDQVCNMAASIPWKKALQGGSEQNITMEDFMTAVKEQSSSLIAWSLSAEELIKRSGEEVLYPDLLETVQKLNRLFTSGGRKEDKPALEKVLAWKLAELDRKELTKAMEEKADIEHKIMILEEKYRLKEASEDIYSKMLKEYNEKKNELDAKISELSTQK